MRSVQNDYLIVINKFYHKAVSCVKEMEQKEMCSFFFELN